jgi:hypothetical protein
VPFGTGPVVTKLSEQKDTEYLTYSPGSFYDLKFLFHEVLGFYDPTSIDRITEILPLPVKEFLVIQKFQEKLEEIRANTSSIETFVKRFYAWFDGFMVVKFLNYTHQRYYKRIPVKEAATEFLCKTEYLVDTMEVRDLLDLFRKLDKKGKNPN